MTTAAQRIAELGLDMAIVQGCYTSRVCSAGPDPLRAICDLHDVTLYTFPRRLAEPAGSPVFQQQYGAAVP